MTSTHASTESLQTTLAGLVREEAWPGLMTAAVCVRLPSGEIERLSHRPHREGNLPIHAAGIGRCQYHQDQMARGSEIANRLQNGPFTKSAIYCWIRKVSSLQVQKAGGRSL